MEKTRPVPGAAPLGLALFMLSLSVLFAASMVGFLAVRLDAGVWPPPGMPRLPHGLWISTALLLAASGSIQLSLRAVRHDLQPHLRWGLVLTSVLGLSFLICQVAVWWHLVALHLTVKTNLYGFSFYMLTALHLIHVLGGLLPLGLVTRRAFAGRYGAEEHTGIRLCAMYWHFLDAVWLVILLFLVIVL